MDDKTQLRILEAVGECAESDPTQWTGIIERGGLSASEAQKVRAILAETESHNSAGQLPESIGAYRLRRKVAEGGMGVVYEAEQESPRRTVALKMLKPGQSTLITRKRFEHEARALGRLNHPGIAQIYEAGVTSMPFGDQHFFAMEFVDGPPLAEYARQMRLDMDARMELMRKVCDAVEHAHGEGIVHRDLKPSNILVSSGGQPKVLDFGVASLAFNEDATTHYTAAGELLGTLAYMSPEQIHEGSLTVDQRTDVYALGVMLYELVADRPPYNLARLPLPRAAQIICEQEPDPLPSSVPLQLAAVIGKALEKTKVRRYQSVAELGSDLGRFLSDSPVLAKPSSQWEQLKRFARRNRTLVASTAAVILVLAAGTVVSTLQALRARRAELAALDAEKSAIASRDAALAAEKQAAQERDRARAAEKEMRQQRQRADQEAANAFAVTDFLQNDLLAQASPEMQGGAAVRPDPELKVRTALDRAAERMETQFAGKPLIEASIRQTVGNTYLRLGLIPEARRQMERALDLRRKTLGEGHLETLQSIHSLAWLLQQQKDYTAAEPLQEQILAARVRLLGERHPETLRAMNNLAGSYLGQLKMTKAQPMLERLVKAMIAVRGKEDPSTLVVMNNLGIASQRMGRFAEAERIHHDVAETRKRKLGEMHPDTLISWNNQAVAMYAAGRYAEASALHSKVLARRKQVLGEKHPSALNSMANIGLSLEAQGHMDTAEEMYRKVCDLRREVLGDAHPDTLDTLQSLARVRLLRGHYQDAATAANLAMNQLADTINWQRFYTEALLGQSLIGQGRGLEGAQLLNAGCRGLERVAASIPVWQQPLSLGLARKWLNEFETRSQQTARKQ